MDNKVGSLKLYEGNRSSIKKKFTAEEVAVFSEISMDSNRIHTDEHFASKTRFKKPIVQGPLVASLIGGVLGSSLPGNGTIYMSQYTNFLRPVFIEENIVVNVEILSIRSDKNIVTLRTWVLKENGEIAIDGKAIVLALDKGI